LWNCQLWWIWSSWVPPKCAKKHCVVLSTLASRHTHQGQLVILVRLPQLKLDGVCAAVEWSLDSNRIWISVVLLFVNFFVTRLIAGLILREKAKTAPITAVRQSRCR
jgi:hypothetical protein